MEEKLIEKEGDEAIAKKKVYTPPTLTVYGKLTELTAGGTGTMLEPQNPGDPQPPPKPRP